MRRANADDDVDFAYDPDDPEGFRAGQRRLGGAHQVRNDGDEPARVVMWSEVVLPTATAYPDSGKLGVYTGDPAEDAIVRRADAVGYYDGET